MLCVQVLTKLITFLELLIMIGAVNRHVNLTAARHDGSNIHPFGIQGNA